MNYSPQAIAQAQNRIGRSMAMQVLYHGGVWRWKNPQGQWEDAPPNLAVAFQTVLDDAQADWAAQQAADQANKPPDQQPENQSWWQRASQSRTVRQVLRPVRRYVGTLAAVGVVASVRAAGGYGEAAGQDVVQGAESVVGQAVQTGVNIGHAILEGVLQPFGKTGEAVGRLSQTLTKNLTDGIAGIFKTVSNVVGTGGKLIGGAAGMGGVLAGGAVGGLAGLGGATFAGAPLFLIGAALGAALGVAIMKAIETVTSAIGGLLGAVGAAFGRFGDAVTSTLKAVQDVVSDTVQALLGWSKQVLDLSQASGLPVGRAQGALGFLGAFGVKGSEVGGLQQPAWLQGILGRAFGLSGAAGSPEQFESYRHRYAGLMGQGTIGGFALARAMEGTLGFQGLRSYANLPDAMVARQQQRQQAMAGALGMNPQQILQAQQNFALLMASVSQFAELVKTKIAAELLPYLTAGLDKAISWLSANSGKIAGWIETGVSTAWEWFKKIGLWLYADFPPLVAGGLAHVLRFGATFVHGMADLARDLSSNSGIIRNIIGSVLQGVDNLVGALRVFVAVLAGVAAFVALIGLPGGIIAAPAAALAATALTALATQGWQTHLSEDWSKTKPFALGGTADKLDAMGTSLDQRAAQLDKFAAGYDATGRRQEAARLFGTLDSIDKKLANGALETRVKVDPSDQFKMRIETYIVQRQARAISRVS